MRALRLILLCCLLPGAAQAQTVNPDMMEDARRVISEDVDSIALTIYPNDLALIREMRTIDLPAGVVDIQFFGVTDMIIPQSAVLEAFEGLRLEGNFDSDLISPAKLLSRSVGEALTIRRLNPVTGKSDLVVAELVSAAPSPQPGPRGISAVFRTAEGVEGYQCSGLSESIILSKLPKGLHSVPVLSTRVVSEASGPKNITLTYLTRGLEWGADYRMDVAETKKEGSILGWLTLKNKTSKSFKDTDLFFVAGSINQVTEPKVTDTDPAWDRVATCVLHKYSSYVNETVVVQAASTSFDGVAEFSGGGGDDVVIVSGIRKATVREANQEDLGDYKLYRAPQAVSVNAHQSKQIAFMFKEGVEFDTSYSWTLSDLDGDLDEKLPVQSHIVYEIDNDQDGSLAASFPAGSLRVMSQRQDSIDVFIGEGDIANTPVGGPLDVAVADSFLVTARLTDTYEDGERVSASVKITNASDREIRAKFDFDILKFLSIRLKKGGVKLPPGETAYSFTVPAEGSLDFSFEGALFDDYGDGR